MPPGQRLPHPANVLLRFFRRPRFQRPPPPSKITLTPIGWVRNRRPRPHPRGWERLRSRIELLPKHAPKAEGLERYSHVVVVCYLDLAESAPEHPARMRLPSGREVGILATRSQLRPNHLGVSVCRLLGREGAVLHVVGLDAIDGTPVLDVKPYLPAYDAVPDARVPDA